MSFLLSPSTLISFIDWTTFKFLWKQIWRKKASPSTAFFAWETAWRKIITLIISGRMGKSLLTEALFVSEGMNPLNISSLGALSKTIMGFQPSQSFLGVQWFDV